MSYTILSELRKIHKLKQEDLANRLQIKQETLSKMENGRQTITEKYAQMFGTFFKVNPEIFTDTNEYVINHNIGTYSKSIHRVDTYNESDKEIILGLFKQLQTDKDAFNAERIAFAKEKEADKETFSAERITLSKEKAALALERKQLMELMKRK